MKATGVFGDSFLDGFTMAGFVSGLRRPGEATALFADRQATPSVSPGLSFEPSWRDGVKISGDLHAVPEQALHAMMDLLKREDEGRKSLVSASEKAMHGASR